jgi:hypothetical protein
MISMSKQTKREPSAVVEAAVRFFGPGGQGLDVVEQGPCCARFEGGGGHVYVESAALEATGGSDVRVQGREWDYQIKQFMRQL